MYECVVHWYLVCQVQRLAGCLCVHGDQGLVDQLGRHAAAHGPEMEDLRGVAVKHRSQIFAYGLWSAHHHSQRAIVRALRSSRHWSIDVHDAVPLGLFASSS